MLQRQFRIGYNRAARLMENLENNGIVGPEDGARPRKVIITRAEYNELRRR
jgi:S-DNA-T family DNA segregation ATPase FtsK/SpoIIIE